jgi:serine/threonine protein kinase
MSQDVPPSRGLVAGKYELLRLIGKGGMGSVWEGQHTSLGTRVAIKFIEKEYADNEEARKRFDNEAHAAAALQSKHAIQIHDHGVTDDGKPYIVMEMLVGEPLDKRLERLRILPLRDAAVILQQVCRGLQKAHEHGIVHRDLKPENIFLVKSPDDDEETAKVLDFGIAKIRTGGADQNISANTRTGAVLGTPFYMSPEQARGLRDIDHRSDLWSIGVIAFKCVTGRLPFEGESLGDLLVKICTVPIPVPSQLNPQLPPSFDAWFSRALDRDPNRRFGSAHELAEALAYAAGLSVRQGVPSASVPGYAPPPGTGTAMGGLSPVPYGAPYTQPHYNATPPPYAPPMNVTSAPYVTSATPSSGGSKAAYVFAAFVALIGIGLAGWGGWTFLHARAEASPSEVPTATATTTPEAPTAVVTPLTTSATTATATASDTSATPAPTAKSTAGSHHTTHVTHHTTTHPTATATATAPTATSTATVTYTVTPPPHPTSTHTGDFGAGF